MTEEELWWDNDNTGNGIFVVFKSAEIRSVDENDPYTEGKLLRCDYGKVGPVGLLWEPNDGTLLGKTQWGYKSPDITDGSLKEFTQIVSYQSHFYIVYSTRAVKNTDGSWGDFMPEMNCYPGTQVLLSPMSARTLGGLFRLIWEWSTMNEEPFNDNSLLPLIAKKILSVLLPPEEVMAEIMSFPDQELYRYLKGEQDINVSSRLPGPYTLSPAFKAWIQSSREKLHPVNTEWLVEL